MRLAFALAAFLFTSASGATDDSRQPGLRGKPHGSKQSTAANEHILGETNKSKDPSDPPFEGGKPDTIPPPDVSRVVTK